MSTTSLFSKILSISFSVFDLILLDPGNLDVMGADKGPPLTLNGDTASGKCCEASCSCTEEDVVSATVVAVVVVVVPTPVISVLTLPFDGFKTSTGLKMPSLVASRPSSLARGVSSGFLMISPILLAAFDAFDRVSEMLLDLATPAGRFPESCGSSCSAWRWCCNSSNCSLIFLFNSAALVRR